MKVTCDSNVLVYAVDAENSVKRTRAQDIVARTARQNGILTLQALAEFYNVSTKRRLGAGDDPERGQLARDDRGGATTQHRILGRDVVGERSRSRVRTVALRGLSGRAEARSGDDRESL